MPGRGRAGLAGLAVAGAVAVAAALPAGAGGTGGSAATTNPLCTQFRTADPTGFRQIFPGRGGLSLCSRIQAHREACVIQTGRDVQAPESFLFQFSCRTPVRRLRAATKAVTQFVVSLRRTVTELGSLSIGGTPPRPAGFRCGVRRYTGRSSLVCIRGFVPYGKVAFGSDKVSPNMGCDVRPLVALRVANGNWDIFAIHKAPRTLNGPPCPGAHF
jgi:hypothetical protein